MGVPAVGWQVGEGPGAKSGGAAIMARFPTRDRAQPALACGVCSKGFPARGKALPALARGV